MNKLYRIDIMEGCSIQVKEREVNYHEIIEKVDRIASRLKDIKGPVAVLLNNREYYIYSILAAITMNKTFVPINTTDPYDRVKYIIEKCGIESILCSKDEYITTAKLSEYTLLHVDEFLNEPTYVSVNKNVLYKPEDIMYILFTSGSTGLPKGVEITRKNFLAFAKGICQNIEFTSRKSILFHTNVSFDIHFLEVLIALGRGMKVVVLSEKECNNVRAIKKAIVEREVRYIQMTPSKMRLMLTEDKNSTFLDGVEVILIGGEALPPDLFTRLMCIRDSNKLNFRIYNVYGPTETTIWSTVCDLTQEKIITVGRAIDSAEIYILNDALEIISNSNEEGEIFIAGDIVGQGYVNEPQLTNEKFIFISDLNNRQLRGFLTGDIGKWDDQKRLVCLGRKDYMVKINGKRIELEEIEKVALEYLGMCVVVKYDGEEGSVLVAYHNNPNIDIAEVKQKMACKLPVYMIPSVYMYIDEFPYTNSYKVDRKRLLEIFSEKAEELENYNKCTILDDEILGNRVLNIIKNNMLTKITDLTNYTQLKELGIDSISFIKVIVAIEEEIGIRFEDDKLTLNAFTTYSDLLGYIECRKKNVVL